MDKLLIYLAVLWMVANLGQVESFPWTVLVVMAAYLIGYVIFFAFCGVVLYAAVKLVKVIWEA